MTAGTHTVSAPLSPFAGRRVLIWGASGFIGQRVALALASERAELHLVSRSEQAAAGLRARPELREARILIADAADATTAAALVDGARPAVTFNLAGYGIDPSERDEETALTINARWVAALCDAVASARDRSWQAQALVHVGSAAEYGQTDLPVHEGSPTGPVSAYGKSKLAGTLAFRERCAAHGLGGVVARLFMVYGPGEHERRLFPSLVRAARDAEPIDLSSGTQQLDYTFVDDVAQWLLRLALSPASPGEIVHLATGRLTAVRTFVDVVATILNMDRALLRFGRLPPRPDDVRYGPVSTSRLRDLTGGVPATTVADGVRRTLAGRGPVRDHAGNGDRRE